MSDPYRRLRAAFAMLPLASPLQPACVSSPFGWRGLSVPIAGHLHPGIDIPAPSGAWVHAAAAGSVLAIRRTGLGGLWVELRHAGGMATLYAHLGSLAPSLAEGRARVAAGEPLGRVGRTGMSFGAHLYFCGHGRRPRRRPAEAARPAHLPPLDDRRRVR